MVYRSGPSMPGAAKRKRADKDVGSSAPASAAPTADLDLWQKWKLERLPVVLRLSAGSVARSKARAEGSSEAEFASAVEAGDNLGLDPNAVVEVRARLPIRIRQKRPQPPFSRSPVPSISPHSVHSFPCPYSVPPRNHHQPHHWLPANNLPR